MPIEMNGYNTHTHRKCIRSSDHAENEFETKNKKNRFHKGRKWLLLRCLSDFFVRFVFRFIHWAYFGSHYCSTSECTTWCRAVRFITPRFNYTILRFWEFKLKNSAEIAQALGSRVSKCMCTIFRYFGQSSDFQQKCRHTEYSVFQNWRSETLQ